jgi:hypothetical protein
MRAIYVPSVMLAAERAGGGPVRKEADRNGDNFRSV